MPLYSLLLLTVLGLGSPIWLFRMATSGRYRRGLAGRLGFVPAAMRDRDSRRTMWVHAVSVGEVLAAAELVGRFSERHGDWAIAISTTTEAGQRLARQRFPAAAVFYLPLDFAVLVRRYLRVLRPRLLVLMESELWPNLLREAERSGTRIAVVNARISDRSFPRYLRLRRLWRPILRPVSLFLAQGDETAARLRAIGVPGAKVRVSGNLKYDLRDTPETAMVERLRCALAPGTRLLVAGSTLEYEEAQMLRAWRRIAAAAPGARLLLAPRHPDRFAAVAALVEAEGFRVQRASELADGAVLEDGAVVVLDTIGDLAAVYGLGAAAFVGGSLAPAGGHNPLEPARFGVPVVMGPHVANFREIVQLLQAEGGIRILAPGEDLAAALSGMLRGDAAARELGQRGQAVMRAQAGAAERAVDALDELLAEGAGR